MKIYSDDPVVPYKTTKIGFKQTKAEIDGVLARWGTIDTYWHWDPEHNDIYVQFKIEEKINDLPVKVIVRLQCPTIWDKKNRNKGEQINWNVSMRCLWWFIKTHMEMAYVLQSEKTVAFLPYISAARSEQDRRTLKDLILPRIESEQRLLQALPEKQRDDKIIDVKGDA